MTKASKRLQERPPDTPTKGLLWVLPRGGFSRHGACHQREVICTLHGQGNTALIRQSRPDSGLGIQVQAPKSFQVVPSSLGSGIRSVERNRRFALVEESREEGNKPLIPLDTFDGNGGAFLLCDRSLGGVITAAAFMKRSALWYAFVWPRVACQPCVALGR